MTPETRPDNGVKPRREHRRVDEFYDRATGEPAGFLAKERAVLARHAPLRALARALAADDVFLDAVERARVGLESAEQVARRYVRRDGRPRRVMQRLVEQAAASPGSSPQLRVLSVAASATFTTAPLAESDPKRWPHARRLPKAAAMVVSLGANRCLVCKKVLTDGAARRRYCDSCERERPAYLHERGDQEMMLGLLNGAADALGVR
jgi:hypothetical protein